jgi:hypothetical protein
MTFEIEPLWLICVSVCTPIAAVVGFAVHLRQVKTLRLQNQKLELEIEKLQQEKRETERRIVIPTTEEVKEYVLFSRGRTHAEALPRYQLFQSRLKLIGSALREYIVMFLICAFLFYFIFDLYRLVLWLSQFFKG